MSIRVNDDDYKFLSSLAKEERGDMSTAVRELVDLGRVMLAVEKYKKGEASLEHLGVRSIMFDIEQQAPGNREQESQVRSQKSGYRVRSQG